MPRKRKESLSTIVLGKKGFIGSSIFRKLFAHYGKSVYGISSQQIDLTNKSSSAELSHIFSPQTVIVFVSGIRAERDSSLSAFEKNIAMVVNVARAIEKKGLKQCIYISTVSVYGKAPKKGKVTESHPIILDSLYALAKYAGEKILENACKENNTPLLILRLPRVYGPGDAYAKYGPSAFVQGILQRGEVTLYGDGKELREFLYVEDVGKIVDVSIAQTVKGLVNVASGISHNFFEAVQILLRTIKKPFTIQYLPRTNEKHDEHYDNTKFRTLFPNYSFTSLEKGLLRTLNQSLK